MQLISAKEELKYGFNIELTPKQKLMVLKTFIEYFDNKYLDITYRNQRLPRLAVKQVLDECYDILKKYYAVDEILGEEE